ncbi:MAG TPA: TonB family protein [Steroidobacteraceae bacterium]|nr:TonB family protein [Steroidobacteraceae bacterium]
MNAAAPSLRSALRSLKGGGEGRAPVRERLTAMLFMAAIAHAIVILGLTFSIGGRAPPAPGMEVLLVSDELPAASRNDRAAYLAQRTQVGAGNTHTLATGSPDARRAARAAPSTPGRRGADTPADATGRAGSEEPALGTSAPSPLIRWLGEAGPGAAPAAAADPAEVAALERSGRGDAAELVLRGDPRTGQWISPDTRASRLAPYLDAWRRKVERVGTLNFPSAARRADLTGSPVIEVALGSDGSLVSATIRRSSGHVEIDQAALQILRLASPFEPFPAELARDYGALRFAYQWEFFGGQLERGSVRASANGTRDP